MSLFTRRRLLAGAGLAVFGAAVAGYGLTRQSPAPIGFDVSPEDLEAARAFLADHPAIDAHAHPGRTFLRGAEHVSGKLYLGKLLGTFEDKAVRDMTSGGLTAAAFAAVADVQVIGAVGDGLGAVRDFTPGEAWESYKRQIKNLQKLSTDGLVYPIKSTSDFDAARQAGKPGAFLTVEGGGFLEGNPDRVPEIHRDGVRSVTLMHYRTNEIGDIMTAAPVHGGLTDTGRAIVAAMNETGILIDVAHASEDTAMGVIDASTKPVIASHTHVHSASDSHPRFISQGLAKAVADAGGGVLGAWPAGIGISDLNGYVSRTLELINAVGIDHVCMGTDMDANYKPVFDTYANLPYYVVGLRGRGLSDEDVAKVIGGNFLRIFAAIEAN